MRRLNERNKSEVYYALYEGKQPTYEDELYTGENVPTYSDVVEARMVVGIVTGAADLEQYGITDSYSVKLVTDDVDCPIDTDSVMWVAQGYIAPYDESYGYLPGDKCIKDGRIVRYESGSWEEVPHTHVVIRVAKSFGYITYLLKEVQVSYENSNYQGQVK